jgi:UTP--glucose-1-phosphate uridylyltransferase
MSKQDQKVKKGVITVAGLGTRFLPVTKSVPKEMLPILGKPVLQYTVEEMIDSGITNILFVTGKGDEAIENHFVRDLDYEKYLEKEGKLDRIQSIIEVCKKANFFYTRQSNPLGNGHALLQAKEFVGDEPFAFSDGDSIMDSKTPVTKQLLNVFEDKGECVMGVGKMKDKEEMTKYGNVKARKIEDEVYEVEELVEKPPKEKVSKQGLIIAGMRYVFNSNIWEYLETQQKGKDDEIWVSDAANRMIKDHPLYACEYKGQYFDTGNPEALLKAEMHFAKK